VSAAGRIAAACVTGVAIGVVSRLIDTTSWAPDWIGYVFSSWLAAAWLVGAFSGSVRSGALTGGALLVGIVAAYLATAGAGSQPAAGLWGIAAAGAPIFGGAGATWRDRGRRASWGGALLGAALIVESVALQWAVGQGWERLLLGGEFLLGVGLVIVLRSGRKRST